MQSPRNCCGTLISPPKSSSMQTDPVNLFILLDMLDLIPEESRLPVLSEIFSTFLSIKFALSVPKDFLCLSANAMVQLSEGGWTNVLYNLAKGMGTMKPDVKVSRFPITRMPMGLVEYTALFLQLIIYNRYGIYVEVCE